MSLFTVEYIECCLVPGSPLRQLGSATFNPVAQWPSLPVPHLISQVTLLGGSRLQGSVPKIPFFHAADQINVPRYESGVWRTCPDAAIMISVFIGTNQRCNDFFTISLSSWASCMHRVCRRPNSRACRHILLANPIVLHAVLTEARM